MEKSCTRVTGKKITFIRQKPKLMREKDLVHSQNIMVAANDFCRNN